MSDSGKKWIESATEIVEPGLYQEAESAVEVAAMFDDSLVEVKHLTRDRDPGARRRSVAWFGIGAALLALAAAAFAIAVGNAADNETALAAWSEAGKPLHDFRPHRISLVYDWMAFGGAIAGLFAIGVGLWRRRAQEPETTFRIADAFPLVEPHGDGFICNFTAGMDGEVIDGATRMSLAELAEHGAFAVPIPNAGRIRVRHGSTTYVLATVPAPAQQPLGAFVRIERRVLGHFAGSAVAHALLLALMYNLPATPHALTDNDYGIDYDRLRRVELKVFEDAIVEPDDAEDTKSVDNTNEGNAGGAEMADAGRQGVQDSANATGVFLIEKRRDEQELSRGEAVAVARNSGLLYVFNSSHAGAQDPFATITGTALDYSSGLGDRDVYGGYYGDEFRDAWGGFGSAPDGMGPGGGGDKWATIGTGSYNTIGDSGVGDRAFYNGRPPGRKLFRSPKSPETVKLGKVQSGKYDKALIRRYIKKKRNQLRYCYEKQLNVDRELEGTVTTVFIINERGAVVSAIGSGMGSREVESCVETTVKSIQFPAPAEGGMHKVTYPFHFHRAGAN